MQITIMDKITEIIPDDIPEWAQQAIDEGQFFKVACDSMKELDKLKRLLKNRHINPTHKAADAFWEYWDENGATHKHGYYESTWGAINAALKVEL